MRMTGSSRRSTKKNDEKKEEHYLSHPLSGEALVVLDDMDNKDDEDNSDGGMMMNLDLLPPNSYGDVDFLLQPILGDEHDGDDAEEEVEHEDMADHLSSQSSRHHEMKPSIGQQLDVMEQLCEFETEAETLVLQAFEDQLKSDPPGEDFKRALFPHVSDQDGANLEPTMSPTNPSGDLGKSSLSAATTQWRALQKVLNEGLQRSSSVFEKRSTQSGDEPKCEGSVDLMLNDAKVFMESATMVSPMQRRIRRSLAKAESQKESQHDGTPKTVNEATIPNETDDIAAADTAEKGRGRPIHRCDESAEQRFSFAGPFETKVRTNNEGDKIRLGCV